MLATETKETEGFNGMNSWWKSYDGIIWFNSAEINVHSVIKPSWGPDFTSITNYSYCPRLHPFLWKVLARTKNVMSDFKRDITQQKSSTAGHKGLEYTSRTSTSYSPHAQTTHRPTPNYLEMLQVCMCTEEKDEKENHVHSLTSFFSFAYTVITKT